MICAMPWKTGPREIQIQLQTQVKFIYFNQKVTEISKKHIKNTDYVIHFVWKVPKTLKFPHFSSWACYKTRLLPMFLIKGIWNTLETRKPSQNNRIKIYNHWICTLTTAKLLTNILHSGQSLVKSVKYETYPDEILQILVLHHNQRNAACYIHHTKVKCYKNTKIHTVLFHIFVNKPYCAKENITKFVWVHLLQTNAHQITR